MLTGIYVDEEMF